MPKHLVERAPDITEHPVWWVQYQIDSAYDGAGRFIWHDPQTAAYIAVVVGILVVFSVRETISRIRERTRRRATTLDGPEADYREPA